MRLPFLGISLYISGIHPGLQGGVNRTATPAKALGRDCAAQNMGVLVMAVFHFCPAVQAISAPKGRILPAHQGWENRGPSAQQHTAFHGKKPVCYRTTLIHGSAAVLRTREWDKIAKRTMAHYGSGLSKWWAVARLGRACPTLRRCPCPSDALGTHAVELAAVVREAFRGAGAEFNAMRPVTVPLGKACSVIVTQFFHHGEIAADGRNLLVCTKNQKPVPARVLQLGPGDYCRLCFEVVPGQSGYEIYYGGEAPAADAVPAWNNSDGLLLETREFKQCNLHRFDSVRDAFNSSKPIGADYVPAVQHFRTTRSRSGSLRS